MLSSKANAALARLKEIEEKYKMKREKQKWTHKENTDSSISSVSIIPSENPSAELKKSPRNISKLKLDIKIPDTRIEGRTEETKLSSEKKKSTSDKMSPEPFEDEADLDVTIMPSKDKSPRSTGKQESLISDVTSIQENSSIESVLDDSMISSKSLSRSKTSRGNFSTASNKSSRREERTKVAGKYEKGKESDKLSEISRGKASSGNSSIIKQLRLPGKSNEKSAFKVRSGLRSEERSIEEKVAIKIPNATSLDPNLDRSRSLRDDSVIEESVGTVDGSEIISELSYKTSITMSTKTSITMSTKTSTTTKNYNNSIKNSKYSAADNAVVVPSSSKQLATESGYANDTFEDISSSTLRSQSQHKKIMDRSRKIDSAESSTKKIETVLLEQHKYQQNNKTIRNEHVTLKPNITEVNLEPSNYVNTNSDNAIVSLIKSPKLASSEKSYQEYRPESIKRNNSNVTNFVKNISDSSESLTRIDDVTNTDEKKNSSEIKTTSVQQESSRKEHGKASNKIRERAMINITGPPVAEDIIKSSSSEEKKTEKENVFEESSNQRISQNAEEVLRKLHKDAYDALIKRHASSKNANKTSQKSSKSKIESENKDVMKARKEISKEENESHCSLEENEMHNRNDLKSSQRKKKIVKVTKSAQVYNTGNHKEEKTSRFDEKQMRGLRKRIVKLRLQQEREDLQKYLQELKNSRLESGCTQSYFYPLEFPKIAEFTQSEAMNLESKLDDQHVMLRERVSAIKRCLKDQYILYRDYCSIAQAINAHYVPTTLQDAKKTIRELQKMTITSR